MFLVLFTRAWLRGIQLRCAEQVLPRLRHDLPRNEGCNHINDFAQAGARPEGVSLVARHWLRRKVLVGRDPGPAPQPKQATMATYPPLLHGHTN
jgi:hypothetical protein